MNCFGLKVFFLFLNFKYNNVIHSFETIYCYIRPMKIKLLVFLLGILLPVFYEMYRRTSELDYLHIIPKGEL